MKNRNRIKLKGRLKVYLQWPFILTILLMIFNIWVYAISPKAGAVMTLSLVFYIVIALFLLLGNKRSIMSQLVEFAADHAQIQKKLLYDLELPYALLDEAGYVLWHNKAFADVTDKEKGYNKSVTNIFSTITKDKLPIEEEMKVVSIHYNEKDYRVEMKRILIDDVFENGSIIDSASGENYLIAMYLFDETQVNKYLKEAHDEKLVMGLIYIDNYDEALESIDEIRQSLLIALVDRKINKYFGNIDGIVKKIETDKYFIVIKNKYLSVLQKNKFSILDEVKSVNIGNQMSLTLSIGIGANTNSYSKNYDYARTAIDIALARGGDQAVIKEEEKIYYYGGKSKQVEKNTRVKARVKAHALRELMETKDQVFIMGHKIGDVDSFGASIGIYRVCKILNKKAHIIINNVEPSVKPLFDNFVDNQSYENDLFVTSSQAIELIDANSLLVVVDVNKPSITECEEILPLAKTKVIIDHHRVGSEVIENAVLSYIEPYSSSACEMVTEILQYIEDGVKIKQLEADVMYAGMMIDTNNFLNKTGVRTFEAAAYLRRCGADISKVRKLLRSDMAAYKARAKASSNVEVFKEYFAISVCPAGLLNGATVIGAQAADELLDIVGIKASVVLTEHNDKIYISARSIDEINVQLIMERLGGGGHLNAAAAQLTNVTIDEAIKLVKHTIETMLEEGDI